MESNGRCHSRKFIYDNQVESLAVIKDSMPLSPQFIGDKMRIRMMLVMLCVMAISPVAFAQHSVKLFDAVPTTESQLAPDSTYANAIEFDTKQVYLSCPTNGVPSGTLSGPEGTDFLVDNFIRIERSPTNTTDLCPEFQVYGCFTPTAGVDPMAHLGEPVTNSLTAVAPLALTEAFLTLYDGSFSGVYTFKLMDFSYTYGNTEVWLNTSCRIVEQVCHRNNGSSAQKTLNIGASAVAAHLAHGDTLGPCAQ
jgi:hypothetical protein